MTRTTAKVMTSLLLVAGGLTACASVPEEPSPRPPITAEDDALHSERVAPPHAMAKRRGSVLSRALRASEVEPHEQTCPMRVPQTMISAEVLDEGVALVFTTYGDVAELRRRVRELAYTHSHESVTPDGPGCGCPLVGNDGAPLMAEASTRAEPVPRGARLVLTPNERNEVRRLRTRVSSRLEHLVAADCPLPGELRDVLESASR